MRFDAEKKKSIMIYLLDKIEQEEKSLSKCVSETYGVNQNTIHTYINELLEKEIIRRKGRGKYELVTQEASYSLKRSNGDLKTDIYAYEVCLKNRIAGLAKNVQSIWAYMFSEMINNVMDHSGAENVQIVIEQNYLKTTVIIRDDGIGIFEKIRKHFSFETLEDAVCELFKGKLTTDQVNHSGEGIFFSSRLADDFFIISDGLIFTNNKYDSSRVYELAAQKFQGTCVMMTLSNFTQKQTYEIFDLYSNVDGGFTKTKIPLKNMFDAAPVSRSQAKRVCNRLNEFQEVTFDFEGVDWMGQGFAHQIFIVFAGEHPDIALVPINMNEAVTKMYQHVRGAGG